MEDFNEASKRQWQHDALPHGLADICQRFGGNFFDVYKSVHHHTNHVIQPTRCNSFTSLLLEVYVWLNMFRWSPHPSSGVYSCTTSLWVYRWREAAVALLFVVWQVILPDHDQQRNNGI